MENTTVEPAPVCDDCLDVQGGMMYVYIMSPVTIAVVFFVLYYMSVHSALLRRRMFKSGQIARIVPMYAVVRPSSRRGAITPYDDASLPPYTVNYECISDLPPRYAGEGATVQAYFSHDEEPPPYTDIRAPTTVQIRY